MSVAGFQHNFICKSKQRVRFCHLATVGQLLTRVQGWEFKSQDYYQLDEPGHLLNLKSFAFLKVSITLGVWLNNRAQAGTCTRLWVGSPNTHTHLSRWLKGLKERIVTHSTPLPPHPL